MPSPHRIIAVGYEARAFGVTRQMRGDEAKQKCPAIQLVQVPCVRGKADLTKYALVTNIQIILSCKISLLDPGTTSLSV